MARHGKIPIIISIRNDWFWVILMPHTKHATVLVYPKTTTETNKATFAGLCGNWAQTLIVLFSSAQLAIDMISFVHDKKVLLEHTQLI